MKKIGFVGLGDMGFFMARNLLEAGHSVRGFDLNPQRLERFKEQGGVACSSSADVAKDAEVVFVMTMNGEQAKSVLFEENGLCSTLKKDSVIIVTSSCGATAMQDIAGNLPAGIDLIDCPVSGGTSGADAGKLTVMVADRQGAVDSCRDILEVISGKIYFCGEQPGLGQKAKSCAQAICGVTYIAAAEALALGVKAGLKAELLTEIIGSSVAGSQMFNTVANKVMDRQFKNSGAALLTMYKDMGLVMDLAKESEAPLFITAQANEFFKTAWVKDRTEDAWAVAKITEEIIGVKTER